MDKQNIKNILNAVLFVAGEGISIANLSALFDMDFDEFEKNVEEIIAESQKNGDGIVIARHEDKLTVCTNKKYAKEIQRILKPAVKEKLSNAVLETLSIIAYKQPVTRSEIDEIRGVRCAYAVSLLIEKGMVAEVGVKDVLGRPTLLGTTADFLKHFGINSIDELPKIDFEKYANEEMLV